MVGSLRAPSWRTLTHPCAVAPCGPGSLVISTPFIMEELLSFWALPVAFLPVLLSSSSPSERLGLCEGGVTAGVGLVACDGFVTCGVVWAVGDMLGMIERGRSVVAVVWIIVLNNGWQPKSSKLAYSDPPMCGCALWVVVVRFCLLWGTKEFHTC